MIASFNIEIYSLLILLVLVVDYYSKFKKQLNKNSYLFLGVSTVIALLSVINIVISFIEPSIFKDILSISNYALSIIPSSFIYTYIKINFFNQEKYIKASTTISDIICLSYWILLILILFLWKTNDIAKLSHVLYFSILPLLLIVIEWSYYSAIKKEKGKFTILFVSLIPIIGTILDTTYNQIYLFTAAYIFSLLILYVNKKNILTYTDALTGLYNRHILESSVIIDNFLKNNNVILYGIDIDKFKNINDTYGHLCGDMVLKEVASILKKSTRRSDYVLRTGGDEFLIIAEIKENEEIKLIKKRIEENLNEYNKDSKIKVNLSIGYEKYNGNTGLDLDNQLNSIDRKMYKNKNSK